MEADGRSIYVGNVSNCLLSHTEKLLRRHCLVSRSNFEDDAQEKVL